MTDVIFNSSLDPYFNLAAEQYLLDSGDTSPVFMLWRNSPAVIIGKNQNAYAEINRAFTDENNVKVVRRLTGGGAVFHDEGNVNYTFISPKEGVESLDFARFCAPVIESLRALGANAVLSGRNDIEIDGYKVSGNAQCVRSGKLLHHGTLLWSADLSALAGALNVDPEKIESKGIKSVRSRVANIRDILKSDMTALQFIEFLFSRADLPARSFTAKEKQEIERLCDLQYRTWEWNWGRSRDLSVRIKKRFPYGSVEVSCIAKNGVIESACIGGDFFGVGDVGELCEGLRGVRLEKTALNFALADSQRYISGSKPEEIAELFLSF